MINERIINRNAIRGRSVMEIMGELRINSVSDLQDQCFRGCKLSIRLQVTLMVNFDTQNQGFY